MKTQAKDQGGVGPEYSVTGTKIRLLLRALEHILAAEELISDVPGATDPTFRDANLRDVHLELQHLGRRLRNIALVYGCPPDAVHALTTRHLSGGTR